jgi:hypothetical protein
VKAGLGEEKSFYHREAEDTEKQIHSFVYREIPIDENSLPMKLMTEILFPD